MQKGCCKKAPGKIKSHYFGLTTVWHGLAWFGVVWRGLAWFGIIDMVSVTRF